MTLLKHGILAVIFLVGTVKGACPSGSMSRYAYAQVEPYTLHTITLANHTNAAIPVIVEVTATGANTFNNSWVNNFYGVCRWNAPTNSCSWEIPNGSSFASCPSYTSCSTATAANPTYSIPAKAMIRFGFGSRVNTSSCNSGCSALYQNAPGAGALIKITVCGTAGFIIGQVTNFDDLTNSFSTIPINGGRPF